MTLFTRDRFTWLAYSMLGYYSYTQASLGPVLPFLGTELNIDYTVQGFHSSAFALGMILAGLSSSWLARRLDRRIIFWVGGAGMSLFALLLTLGRQSIVTIACAFFMAYMGSFLLVMIQATLSDRHGERRAIAITEANILASVTAALAPLVIGLGQASGITWRLVLYVSAAVCVVAFISSGRVALPPQPIGKADSHLHKPLPKSFWAYWLVVFIGVSIEWCMILWSSSFLIEVVGLEKNLAATSVSLFFAANVVGRAAGSYLTRRFETGKLLLIAVAIVMVGFPIFWLPRLPILNLIGLVLCGLGVANLFPLTLSAATSTAPEQANAASARVSLSSGLAILIAPQILASAADLIGLQYAYGIVVLLLAAAISVTLYANRLAVRKEPTQATLPLS
jgi:MFS family permease